jgi:hypothetical protein
MACSQLCRQDHRRSRVEFILRGCLLDLQVAAQAGTSEPLPCLGPPSKCGHKKTGAERR